MYSYGVKLEYFLVDRHQSIIHLIFKSFCFQHSVCVFGPEQVVCFNWAGIGHVDGRVAWRIHAVHATGIDKMSQHIGRVKLREIDGII